ncbi:N-acetyltransferase [Roseomonas sp. NAR14]|uniref:N-acetyltransferase n=1 Tax=Roseomonas acroporae TaxID=2937791 RepID=A0A9X1YA74_9PROT|nr:GNAT family N-acetyltransferase [Roseomonas acroporae]MCK8785663.1 N-acetyltransferase [Roseomonas acroporae]
MSNAVEDNPGLNRFELAGQGAVAILEYERHGDRLVLTHTEVPQELAGQGIGSRLVRGVLDRVREEGGRIEPRCDFVASFIERHPEYRDLVAGAH